MACHQQCLGSTFKQKLTKASRHVYGDDVFFESLHSVLCETVASLESEFTLFSRLLLYFCTVACREFVISLRD